MKIIDILLRPFYNKEFRLSLDNIFWKNVTFILALSSVPPYKRYEDFGWDDIQENIIDYFKEKYGNHQNCIDGLYYYVSKDLRNEYDAIYCLIKSFLDDQFK